MITVEELRRQAKEAQAIPDALRGAANTVANIAVMARQNTQRAIDAEAKVERLKADNERLTAALKKHMSECSICKGRVTYSGKDFEELECRACKASRAALKGGE